MARDDCRHCQFDSPEVQSTISNGDSELTPAMYRQTFRRMTSRNPRLQKLFTSGALTLLCTICAVGVGVLDGVCQDTISSETEEARELNEDDEVNQHWAVVDHNVTLIHGHSFDEWRHAVQSSELLSHSWRWCSRGPPAA
ncbi:MAG TPA: hypothetical protein EYQ63_08775 [Fuerstia sp.]|nr:hypothetical protein [Fuerstiella sp.]